MSVGMELEAVTRVARVTLRGARADRLFFAQVREDPLLEIAALMQAGGENRIAVVSSGGCTALSLLAAGARELVAVDANAAQNHLVELKLAAVSALPRDRALALIGGRAASAHARARAYAAVRPLLSPGALAYWDARPTLVTAGVNAAGVTERFMAAIALALRHVVLPRGGIDRMLACTSRDEQRALFAREWEGWRWRALFALLCNRAAIRRAYEPAFFRHASRGSFAAHFRELAERTLTTLPVASNYFVHAMLTGAYPVDAADGVPPYLSAAGAAAVAEGRQRVTLVDGGMTAYLRTRDDASLDGFALSNICEWLDEPEIDALFAEIARVAAPGARVVFRNFVGWTDVPRRWAHVVVEDRALGETLIQRDRSGVQRRIAVCRVERVA